MVGESLEQHCLTQFNPLRMTAFPNAYFEKDNDARSGSKGDFIFREALLSSENNLRLANNKAEDLSIKRLTKNAPLVRAMFDELDDHVSLQ